MKASTLTTKTGKVKELTRKDISKMKPANKVLPEELLNVLPKRSRGERGKQKSPKKISVTLRCSPEVIKYFKAMGPGWQTKIDLALQKCIKKGKKAA